MAKTPRMTISLSRVDQDRLSVVLASLGLRSAGQLFEFMLSGDSLKIDLITNGFKRFEVGPDDH